MQYNVNSDFAGSTIRVNGRTLLTGNHETTANALIANLPIDRVLAVAGRRDLPVTGTLSANGAGGGHAAGSARRRQSEYRERLGIPGALQPAANDDQLHSAN